MRRRLSDLADARATVLRLIPLAIADGYVAFVAADPSVLEWVTALVAGVIAIFGYRYALIVVAIQAVVLLVGELPTGASLIAVKVLLSLSLIELAYRRALVPTLTGAAFATGTYLWVMQASDGAFTGNLSAAYGLLGVVAAPVLLGMFLRSTREALLVAQARAAELERRSELEAEATRLTERTSVARELHDVIAHHVASISLRVGVARDVLDDLSPQAQAVLDDVHRQSGAALHDLRQLIVMLRDPSNLAQSNAAGIIEVSDLMLALENAVDVARGSGFHVVADVDPEIAEVDAASGLCLLRIVQEGLTNATKHGSPESLVQLRVTRSDSSITIDVENQYAGTGGDEHASTSGFGLVGLRERVAALDGSLETGRNGDRWLLHARVPQSAPVISERRLVAP